MAVPAAANRACCSRFPGASSVGIVQGARGPDRQLPAAAAFTHEQVVFNARLSTLGPAGSRHAGQPSGMPDSREALGDRVMKPISITSGNIILPNRNSAVVG